MSAMATMELLLPWTFKPMWLGELGQQCQASRFHRLSLPSLQASHLEGKRTPYFKQMMISPSSRAVCAKSAASKSIYAKAAVPTLLVSSFLPPLGTGATGRREKILPKIGAPKGSAQDGGEAALQAFFKVVGQQAQCLKAQRRCYAAYVTKVLSSVQITVAKYTYPSRRQGVMYIGLCVSQSELGAAIYSDLSRPVGQPQMKSKGIHGNPTEISQNRLESG